MKISAKKPDVKDNTKSRRNIPFPALRISSPTSVVNNHIQRVSICPCDGGCPRCVAAIQPKLTIGPPNDKYEQEADRVADQTVCT